MKILLKVQYTSKLIININNEIDEINAAINDAAEQEAINRLTVNTINSTLIVEKEESTNFDFKDLDSELEKKTALTNYWIIFQSLIK